MISFKNFINESALIVSNTFDSKDDILKIINTKCSNFSWMLDKSTLYRGDKTFDSLFSSPAAIINTSNSFRTSKTISNWYTLILDNSPDYKDFPKRSKSLICTNSIKYASEFSDDTSRDLYNVIPTSNSSIGSVGKSDMWKIKIKIPDIGSFEITQFGDFLDSLKKYNLNDKDWTSFSKVDKLLKNDKEAREYFAKSFNYVLLTDLIENNFDNFMDNFLKTIEYAYSPKVTGISLATPENIESKHSSNEYWISGQVLVIKNSFFKTELAK